MKTCYVCGSANEDSFTKCSMCGADLPVTQAQDDMGDEQTTYLEPLDAAPTAPVTSGFQLKKDTPAPDTVNTQAPMNQNMGMGMQSPNMGYQNPGMQNPNLAYQNPGMQNQNMGMGNPGIYSPTAAPVPANKGKIFAILGALTAVLVIAFLLIFNFGGKTKEGVATKDQVPKVFIEAMNDRDMDKMISICPPFLDPGKDDLQAAFDSVDAYGIKFTFLSVTDTYDYTDSELKDLQNRIKNTDNTNAKIEAAADLTYDYKISVDMMGESYDETQSESIIAIKYKGKWFLYE